MEESCAEAVKNNVFGTLNLLTSAAEHGVQRLVQLSTDKAVNPTNVMGATKRVTEMLIQSFARNTKMQCVAVRFGNVLGSHGSVIPLFESQIKNGGPLTLTHPGHHPLFYDHPRGGAAGFAGGALAKSGAIYVLDMGEPVRIKDLAEKLIRFYGYTPGVDMQIKITGLRPGEKLYEELLMDKERDGMTSTPTTRSSSPRPSSSTMKSSPPSSTPCAKRPCAAATAKWWSGSTRSSRRIRRTRAPGRRGKAARPTDHPPQTAPPSPAFVRMGGRRFRAALCARLARQGENGVGRHRRQHDQRANDAQNAGNSPRKRKHHVGLRMGSMLETMAAVTGGTPRFMPRLKNR